MASEVSALPLAAMDFRYSPDQWAPIEKELIAAQIDPQEARPIIEEAVVLWRLTWTKGEARQEADWTRRQIERFKRAAADIDILLPTSARKSLTRIIATLERLADEDSEEAVRTARSRSLGEELCRTWRYQLGGEVKGSWDTLNRKAGGPLVRFLAAATAPIEGEAMTREQALERIKQAKKKIAVGDWPP